MNFKKIYKLIDTKYKNLNFEIEEVTREYVKFASLVTVGAYFDDTVRIEVLVYANIFSISVVFDRLDRTEENLKLINDLNENSLFYKAYISARGEEGSEKDYLILECGAFTAPNEKEQASVIAHLLEEIIDDDLMKYLKPLTLVTYE